MDDSIVLYHSYGGSEVTYIVLDVTPYLKAGYWPGDRRKLCAAEQGACTEALLAHDAADALPVNLAAGEAELPGSGFPSWSLGTRESPGVGLLAGVVEKLVERESSRLSLMGRCGGRREAQQ